jgi:hypothetical protein
MSKLTIERIGGLAGFGGENSRLRSHGEIDIDELSKEHKKAIEDLFASKGKAEKTSARDNFRYRISRKTTHGTESIEVDEDKIPDPVKQSVKDEII